MGKVKTFFHRLVEDNKIFWPLTIVVFIFTRLAVWLYPFDSDHWIFYYVGRKFAEGGTIYISAFDHKPPLIFVFNGLMHILFGGNIIFHRLFLTGFTILDIILFYFLLKVFVPKLKLKNPLFAERIGLLLYVFSRNLSQIASSGNNTENLGIIFFIAMLLLYFKFVETRKLWLLFSAGICLSFIFFLKGNFLLLGVPIGLLLLIENYRDLKKLFSACFAFGLPLVLHSLFWIWYFSSKKALYDFFLGSFLFSAKYAKVAWHGNLSKNPNLPISVAIFILPFIAFLIIYFINIKKENECSLFLTLYLIISFFITFGVGPAYPYYFLIVLPILVLLGVTVVENITSLPTSFRFTIYFIILVGLVGSFAISSKQIYNTFAGPVRAEMDEYTKIAKYVDDNSNLNDKVFNYDYGATFYRQANRDSGSRFISASIPLLDEREHFGFGFDDIFIDEMTANKTKFVIISKDKNNIYFQNQRLVDFFKQNYKPKKEFEHFEVLEIK